MTRLPYLNLLLTLLLSFSVLQTSSSAKEVDKDEILCERVPTTYLVGQSLPSKKSDNPCSATAKIQAIAYECGDTMNTYTSTLKFFKENTRKAKDRCREFCKSVSPRCTGRLMEQTSCGFSIPTNRALDTGRNVVHCPKHCKGQAFNYCSLYHANYFSTDEELFKDEMANCYCQKKF